MPGPLDGVRVLDVGQLVQAPQAGALFADMGADVVKIELPNVGDLARWIFVSPDDPRSAYFESSNRGKRSVTLDLRTAPGGALFKRLAAAADVVISNFKPGTMDEWGLGYDVLRELNPRLIWAAGSTFGIEGPDASREGADLAGQAASGLINSIGHDGSPLSPVGVTIADHIGSQNMASGVLAALFERERSGLGQRVDVSLLGGQIWAQAAEITHYLMTGNHPGRANSGHPLLRGLYGIFPTADGWIAIIGVPVPTRTPFFELLGLPQLTEDPRFMGLHASPEDMRELFAVLTPAFQQRNSEEWCSLLGEIGVRFAPVNDYQAVAEDEGVRANGYVQSLTRDDGAAVSVVGPGVALSRTGLQPSAAAPSLGEHTAQVLTELGVSSAEFAALQEQGVV